jgi:hypothetical protein
MKMGRSLEWSLSSPWSCFWGIPTLTSTIIHPNDLAQASAQSSSPTPVISSDQARPPPGNFNPELSTRMKVWHRRTSFRLTYALSLMCRKTGCLSNGCQPFRAKSRSVSRVRVDARPLLDPRESQTVQYVVLPPAQNVDLTGCTARLSGLRASSAAILASRNCSLAEELHVTLPLFLECDSLAVYHIELDGGW